jgi:hypothetical protein
LPGRCISDDRDAMSTPKEYRQQAADCLKLASETTQAFAKAALAELASEFRETADKIKQRVTQEQAGRRY